MIDNPLSYLNKLFELFTERNVSGHDQLVCLHIFEKFNRSYWADTIRISDRELQDLCRLYDSNGKPISIDTIRKAKARLKLKKLIDFKAGSGNNPTEYYFTPLNPTDTPTDSGLVSYTRAGEDVKTLDRLDEAEAEARARAGVKRNAKSGESAGRGKAAAEVEGSVADAHTGALPLRSPEMEMDIHDIWRYETGYPLCGSIVLELEQLANENFKLMHEAIIRGVAGSSGKVKFAYVKAIFNDLKNGKTKKGGERVEQTRSKESDKPKYTEPKYTGNEPWADFDEGSFEG